MNEQVLTNRPLPGAMLNMAHPLTRGLVGCWLFNENGGLRVFDYAPYGIHGISSGFDNRLHPFNGKLFDGSNDNINLGNTSRLEFTSQLYTISMFIYPKSAAGAASFFTRMENGGGERGYRIWFENATLNADTRQNLASQTTSATGTISANEYQFITVVRSSTALITIYKNAVDVTTTHATHLDNDAITVNAIIGIHIDMASNPYNGAISALWIHNRALPKEEIKQLYLKPYDMFMK